MVDRFSSVTWPISRSTCRPTIARPLVYHQFAIDRVWNGHLRWVDWNVDQEYTCRSSYDKNSKTDKNKNRNNFCYLKGKTNSIWPSAKKYSQSLQSREVRRSSKWSFFRQSLPSRSAKSMSRSICHEELSYICLRFRPRCSCGRAETCCEVKFEKVGCFKDKVDIRALPELIFHQRYSISWDLGKWGDYLKQ